MSFLEKRKATFRNKVSSDMPSAYPWVKSKFEKED
jgi:hypothetical protein